MTNKTQKIITAILVSCLIVLSLQSLVIILNLYQVAIFLHLAFWLWIFLWLMVFVLYDLHFKNPGAFLRAKTRHENVPHWLKRSVRIAFTALIGRLGHLGRWNEIKHWLNYLLLPGIIFWSTVAVLYANFGNVKIQQIYIWLSSAAFIVIYWYVKEAFSRKQEKVEADIFAALSVAKIYAVVLTFGAAMVIMRHFCLSPYLFALGIFCLTFLFVSQALFQHKYINLISLAAALSIGAFIGISGYFVYIYWGYNYMTAAIFLAAVYNLLWGGYHYYLDKALTKKVFFEILLICFIIAYFVLSNTNFKAKILDSCIF